MPSTKSTSAALAALACALLGAGVLAAPQALAGTYTVAACGKSASTGEWARSESEPAHVEVHSRCPLPAPQGGAAEPEGLYVTSVLGASTTAPNGASGAWSFSVPAGLSITAFSSTVLLGGLAEWHLEVRTPTQLLTESSGEYVWSGLATNKVELLARCVVEPPASGCRDGATEHKFIANLDDPAVTIEDPVPPSLSNVGGSLWGAHYAAGTLSATFAAADRLGIKRAWLSVDGGPPIATNSYPCAENEFVPNTYTKIEPCANVPEGSLALDSTALTDGAHTVKLTVEDPAGNTASAEHVIVADNHGPPPPESLSAHETSAASLTYQVTWSDPTSPPAPIAETLLKFCAQSTGACSTPEQVGGTSATITLPSPGPWTIYVGLVDSQGKASPYASYFVVASSSAPPEVTTTTTSGGSTPTSRGTATTSTTTTTTARSTAAALSVSGVRRSSELTVSAKVPHVRNGATVKLSAHVKKAGGEEVEVCVGLASVKHGHATLTFKLSQAASSAPVVVVRARYDGRSVAARAAALTRARLTARAAGHLARPSSCASRRSGR